MSTNTLHCEVCDHRIVNGVACDGPTIGCPLVGSAQDERFAYDTDYRVELVAQGGPEEFDAIRGFD